MGQKFLFGEHVGWKIYWEKDFRDNDMWKGKIAKAVLRPEKTLSIEVETKNIGDGFIVYHGTGIYVFCHEIGDKFVVH